jgi:hypothetical protein
LIIKFGVDVVETTEKESTLEGSLEQFKLLHVFFHELKFDSEREFLLSLHGNLFDLLDKFVKTQLFEICDFDFISNEIFWLLIDNFDDILPIFFEIDSFRGKAFDKGKVLRESFDLGSQCLTNFRSFWVIFIKLLIQLEAT